MKFLKVSAATAAAVVSAAIAVVELPTYFGFLGRHEIKVAQAAPAPIVQDYINGQKDVTLNTGSDHSGLATGEEHSMTVCPGALPSGQSAATTYVAPGGRMNVEVTANGSGITRGYVSSMTVGGPGCK